MEMELVQPILLMNPLHVLFIIAFKRIGNETGCQQVRVHGTGYTGCNPCLWNLFAGRRLRPQAPTVLEQIFFHY